MIGREKQVRNLLIALALLSCFVNGSAFAQTQSAARPGPEGAGGEEVHSLGEMVDGFFKSVGNAISSIGTSSPDGKKEEVKKPEPIDAKMIHAKRLDQPTLKDTATGAPQQAVPAPAQPYKVYNSPMIADDPPVYDTYEAPAPRAVREPPPAPRAQKTIFDTKAPPPLPEDFKTNLEDMIVKPLPDSMPVDETAGMQRSRSTIQSTDRRTGEVPPTSALPKQFFPVFPLGAGENTTPQLLPLSSNIGIEEDHSRTTRVIITVHDMQRNSAEGVATLMTLSGGSGEDTLILAPQFSIDLDIVRFAKFLPENGRNVTRWTLEDPWQYGGESRTMPKGRGISSFTAMDILLLFLSDRERFPNLRHLVIAGHGMGADFVQRYAMAGQAPDILAKELIATRFVVANPSTYLYPTNVRPVDNGIRLGLPDINACPRYNSYPFGLLEVNAYIKRDGANAVRLRYPERNVTYLVGDSIASDNYLDRTCEALAQGKDRTSRTKSFGRYMDQSFGEAAQGRHIFSIVPKAGYDPVSMFGSTCGMTALFGDGKCQTQ